MASKRKAIPFAIAIHAGAGPFPRNVTKEHLASCEKGLREALSAGLKILADGGSSINAVEQAVRQLEDCPVFNAGKGAVFNSEGHFELDAAIMDGHTLDSGAVACAQRIRNPISAARHLLETSQHVLLVGKGADAFAKESGLPLVPNSYFWTDRKRAQWEEFKKKKTKGSSGSRNHGTVGAVALDQSGNLAAGTSTGGVAGKWPGRVGDSPLIGAGTYARNLTCAISCTGQGELFIRHQVAHQISELIRLKKMSLKTAVHQVIHRQLSPGTGGLIALAPDGIPVMAFNTPCMFRGSAIASGKLEIAIGKK